MTRKYTLPLTYAPKIPAVLSGRCTQTIRLERKFRARDLIMFHGWEGKPYRSKWSFRTPYWEVTEALPIWIDIWGLRWESKGGYTFDDGSDPRESGLCVVDGFRITLQNLTVSTLLRARSWAASSSPCTRSRRRGWKRRSYSGGTPRRAYDDNYSLRIDKIYPRNVDQTVGAHKTGSRCNELVCIT